MVCIGPRLEHLVRSALPHTDGLTFLSPAERYVRPAATIKSFRKLLDDLVAGGAERIRIVGQIPLATKPQSWHGWARYEAAVQVAYGPYPLVSLCLYASRTTPAEVLADVERTHPTLATRDGASRLNPAFVEPAAFLRGLPAPEPDPAPSRPHEAGLDRHYPHDARQAAISSKEHTSEIQYIVRTQNA